MVSKRLLTRISASNSFQYHQLDEKNEKQDNSTKIEVQFEIECPRCSDTMTLYSRFDSLYYFCQVCDFYLYTPERRIRDNSSKIKNVITQS